jgi:hypothetical protein
MRKHPTIKNQRGTGSRIKLSLRSDLYYLRSKALNYISEGDADGYKSAIGMIKKLRDEHHETITPGFIEEIEKAAEVMMKKYLKT